MGRLVTASRGKYGTIFNAQAHTLRMQKTLTTVLALACGLTLDISQAQTSEEPLEEIIVTGEFAGPGMWQVTHPDHPGHTLWIVGEPPLLPQGMRFRSQQVARVASQSQEILMRAGFTLKPDEKVGVFRMLTLVPAAMKLRKNPDKATLQELIPPDIYARWLVQKKLYLGRDSGVEKMRPFLVAEKLHDAAIKELQLGYGGSWGEVWEVVNRKKIPVTNPTLEFTFKTDNLRGQIKAFSRQKLADEECFARTVELTEALSNKAGGRRPRPRVGHGRSRQAAGIAAAAGSRVVMRPGHRECAGDDHPGPHRCARADGRIVVCCGRQRIDEE